MCLCFKTRCFWERNDTFSVKTYFGTICECNVILHFFIYLVTISGYNRPTYISLKVENRSHVKCRITKQQLYMCVQLVKDICCFPEIVLYVSVKNEWRSLSILSEANITVLYGVRDKDIFPKRNIYYRSEFHILRCLNLVRKRISNGRVPTILIFFLIRTHRHEKQNCNHKLTKKMYILNVPVTGG